MPYSTLLHGTTLYLSGRSKQYRFKQQNLIKSCPLGASETVVRSKIKNVPGGGAPGKTYIVQYSIIYYSIIQYSIRLKNCPRAGYSIV